MTDAATAGSVEAVVPPAGTPATPTPPAANGSPPAGDNPFSGLSEDTRKWVETKGYKSLEDLATGGRNAETKLGSSITIPAADAPKDDWDKFVARLPEDRRPVASADKLEFKRPEGLPENLPYNDALANASKPWMVEAGVTPGQAQALHDKFAGFMADQAKAQQAAVAKSVTDTFDALVKDWGATDSDGFKEKLATATRAVTKLGLADVLKAKGILLPDGAVTDPQIARAFSEIGATMFREDTINGGDTATGGNPFKRDAKGERNVSAISALVKSDPEKAKRLAREAGENPDAWMPNNPL